MCEVIFVINTLYTHQNENPKCIYYFSYREWGVYQEFINILIKIKKSKTKSLVKGSVPSPTFVGVVISPTKGKPENPSARASVFSFKTPECLTALPLRPVVGKII